MRRGAASIAVALLLAGCAAGPGVSATGASPIFDRGRVPGDSLPAGEWSSVAEDTSRYVGEDAAGNAYWAVRSADDAVCIVYVPVEESNRSLLCGGPGLTGTTPDDRIMQFASSPTALTRSETELVGGTLLERAEK
ncbi:hypothetical protein CVS47_01322 [Microbacterium lemovicicum]|uniref:Lipoprotein n=1 Tax=Microbacterium lemovicicum TaxID=1072463 RepID=A0A3S9W9M7_9MICO|nr:hypothetical protein CVS47_01322 [Microbacterium lemovicicum]